MSYKKIVAETQKHKGVLRSCKLNYWISFCNSFNRFTNLSELWDKVKRLKYRFNNNYSPRNLKYFADCWEEFLEKYSPPFIVSENITFIDEIYASEHDSIVCNFSFNELLLAISSLKKSLSRERHDP